jgi:integrase
MADKTVFIIGAGFSANAGLPLQAEFTELFLKARTWVPPPWAVALAFALKSGGGVYIHAERLLAKAGGSKRKGTYELRLRIDQLLPVFGSRPADSIRKNEIVAWLAEQADERDWAATTRNRWQATFSLIFRVGIDNEKIERNPAARIRRKTEGGGRVRFLSEAEEKSLCAAIENRFPEFLPHFLLSLHTGMRTSEQYGPHWSQVDLERRQLHLLKTKNGDPRVIPLNSVALAALGQLKGKDTQAGTAPVFPSARTGDSLQGSRGWFSTALDDAKVLDYTWHCNRHTFASRLVMAGVDLRTVAELLGHRTLQTVMRYSHLAPEHQTSAVDRLVKFSGQNGHQNGHRSVRREKVQNTQTRK